MKIAHKTMKKNEFNIAFISLRLRPRSSGYNLNATPLRLPLL